MANNTNYIKDRHTAKYTAKVLKIQVSTLRKYSAVLEKSGYTFTKSNQNHRSYSIHDILVLYSSHFASSWSFQEGFLKAVSNPFFT